MGTVQRVVITVNNVSVCHLNLLITARLLSYDPKILVMNCVYLHLQVSGYVAVTLERTLRESYLPACRLDWIEPTFDRLLVTETASPLHREPVPATANQVLIRWSAGLLLCVAGTKMQTVR